MLIIRVHFNRQAVKALENLGILPIFANLSQSFQT